VVAPHRLRKALLAVEADERIAAFPAACASGGVVDKSALSNGSHGRSSEYLQEEDEKDHQQERADDDDDRGLGRDLSRETVPALRAGRASVETEPLQAGQVIRATVTAFSLVGSGNQKVLSGSWDSPFVGTATPASDRYGFAAVDSTNSPATASTRSGPCWREQDHCHANVLEEFEHPRPFAEESMQLY
jgi:hypothetical protein